METKLPYKVVCYGEVLWDILPTEALPGGAPMNVAYHLTKLGCNPALITKIGIDDWGKKLVSGFEAQGICTDYFYVDYDVPTGLVYARPNEYNEVNYDIVNPSAWDYIEWNDEMEDLLQQAGYFVYGSLTSRNPASRNTLYQLLEMAKIKVLDINLRAPHFNHSSVTALLQQADILKMNNAELELITGWYSNLNDTADRIQLLQDRFQIATVIVTMGGDGAMIADQGKIYSHEGFKVNVADTIGSGDAFLAGYLSQLMQGNNTEQALQFASGMGAFIATQNGACPAYEANEVSALIDTYSQYSFIKIKN